VPKAVNISTLRSDFEAVNESALQISPDSAKVRAR